MYLENINSPADVKKLTVAQMTVLSQEIRDALLEKLSHHGGHFGPNFGMVEATVALHYVFNSPEDKIVFDVSHQSYPHKMLTGRKDAFLEASKYDDVSGYSEPTESEHDHFVIGHTSTSVSLASGLAKGRDLLGEKGNVIAVIGDGSLSGGEAFEGLDSAGELGSNFIIIVNDNQMSIAENHGGLYKNLMELRKSNGTCSDNYFRSLGLDYIYVDKGNDIQSLITAFQKVKDIDHPIVVHINTLKGKGYAPAEEDKEAWHYCAPFDVATGKALGSDKPAHEDYGNLTAIHLLDKMKEDKSLVAITSGTPTVFGFTRSRREEAGKQFVDVGIAEEQAVAMASGIAKAGAHPVWGVYSTFIQRTYDQLSQDLCINNNPATILVFWGSLSSMNDVTHLCHYDIPLLCNIPNLVYLAPTCKEEYFAMLDWSINYTGHPVAIRVPANGVIPANRPVPADFSDLNRYEVVNRGSKVAILGLGSFFQLGEKVVELLKTKGIDATLINPRYISGIDTELMSSLTKDHQVVVTLEDGALDGGFGEKIARFYSTSPIKVLNYGARKEFVDRYNPAELLKANRIVDTMIVEDIMHTI